MYDLAQLRFAKVSCAADSARAPSSSVSPLTLLAALSPSSSSLCCVSCSDQQVGPELVRASRRHSQLLLHSGGAARLVGGGWLRDHRGTDRQEARRQPQGESRNEQEVRADSSTRNHEACRGDASSSQRFLSFHFNLFIQALSNFNQNIDPEAEGRLSLLAPARGRSMRRRRLEKSNCPELYDIKQEKPAG